MWPRSKCFTILSTINYHQSDETKRIFEYITIQDYIHIFFYNQSIEPAITISIDNNLKLEGKEVLKPEQNSQLAHKKIKGEIKVFKRIRVFVLLLVLILISVLVSSAGLAAGINNCGWPHQDPAIIANQFLERLQTGYQTANISLILSLYNDPVVVVDVTRDKNTFETAESTKAEIEAAFLGLTGIKCDFLDRQITAEGDMIMIRTMRSVTANEIPIYANCLMIMVLRKPFSHRQPWDYVVTNQIVLKEEYLPKSEAGIQQNNTNNTEQQTLKPKKHHHFGW